MRFRNGASLPALGLWLLSLCAPALAQDMPGQWVGDQYLVYVGHSSDELLWTFVKDAYTVSDEIPNLRTADLQELCRTCGVEAWHAYWHGGALHTWANGEREKDGEGREFKRHVLAKWEDGKWRLIGTLRVPGSQLIHVIPCDGDRFIVVSGETDLYENNRQDRSPFCVVAAKEGQKELAIVSSLDHGQDGLRKYMSNPDCFKLAWFSQVIMTDGRATLVNKDTGLYWVFDTETARLVKAGGVFKGVTPDMAASGKFMSRFGVLCANPEKAGTALISAQDEGLYLAETENTWAEYRRMWDSVPPEQHTEELDALLDEFLQRGLGEALARSQPIVWYRLHPENGRLERLDSPPEGGASIRGDTYLNDTWRPMPDGSVRMGWLSFFDANKLSKDQAPKPAPKLDVESDAEAGATVVGERTPSEEPFG